MQSITSRLITVHDNTVYGKAMMIYPAIIAIKQNAKIRALVGRILREQVVGLKERRCPDAHWHVKALGVFANRKLRQRLKIKPAGKKSSRLY